MKEENIKLYHFFAWSDCYGWQHLGAIDGYTTIKELKESQDFNIKDRKKVKIMKLIKVE